ncbi:hypothetical protein [Aliikangiella coralliicola]|uniref:Uncharacterized protein n=1 Tax=Aliikangiella coralliicola TaxID=2592383 RepID=A0A545U6H1_9GAMM|nr:hypothetical protein [Aliikangiella coralliicola]TQV85003.1 hypothetical protein FLL46_21680 [Aliikangiella coralliicola]
MRQRERQLDHHWKAIGQYEYRLQEEQSSDAETGHLMETMHVLDINGKSFIQQVSFKGPDTAVPRRR